MPMMMRQPAPMMGAAQMPMAPPPAPMMPTGPTVKPAAGRTAGELPYVSLPGDNMMPYQSPIEVLQGDAIMSMQTQDQMQAPMMPQSAPMMGDPMMGAAPMASPYPMPQPSMMTGDAMSAMAGGIPEIDMPIQQPVTAMSPRQLAGMGQPMMGGAGELPPMMAQRRYMGM